jgi:activator of 2-hydroxyglutaryl-CoA dehydratase
VSVKRLVISDFRSGVNHTFVLLGCCAALIGSYLPTFRNNLSVPSSEANQYEKKKNFIGNDEH